jgi:predicted Zn-dependent peptidase
LQRNTPRGRSNITCAKSRSILPRNYPLTIPSKIESISAAEVQRVAKKLLDANALTVVVLGKVNESFKSNL